MRRALSWRYPCTGHVGHEGFGAFLEHELNEPRRNIRRFADELGERFQAPFVSLVNSGSSANLAAAMALFEQTGPGEVITGGFTFPTTVTSLRTAGYAVRVVDTEPGGFAVDPGALESALSPRTRAVCLTHFLGFPGRLAEVRSLCDQHGLKLLQDACETMECAVEGRPAHAWGDLTTWSFYHPHHISSFGGGAVIATNREDWHLVESLTHWGRACRCHVDPERCEAPPGMDHNFWYVRSGHNLELSELNAAFGRWQLRSWPKQEATRVRHYRLLLDGLEGLPGLHLYELPETHSSPFVFPLTFDSPALPFAEALGAEGIEARSLMGGPINRHPAFAALPHDGLRRCRDVAERSCFIGIHQTLDMAAIEEALPTLRRLITKGAAQT